MTRNIDTVLYSPYGAFELKAKYQRNFNLSTASVVGFVLLIVLTFWIFHSTEEKVVVGVQPQIIESEFKFKPPPTIIKPRLQVAVDKPEVQKAKRGVPLAVADDEMPEDDAMMASRDDLAAYVGADAVGEGDYDIIIDLDYDNDLPPIDKFVAVEVSAEMIHQVQPEYPRLARQAGLTGLVWIKALVGKSGEVLDAVVYSSSGTASLDAAAVRAARLNKFKPAIQNGRPVAIWVTYKVAFVL